MGAGVGVLAAHGVLDHARAVGEAGPQAQLTAWMAGLFAGGAAGVVVLLMTVFRRRR
ncbi:MAG TPA: hypothetical protein VM865_10220 [Acidobacteriaceae bacterium]|nr:hypothetical protein [Acidobacteriaceae bacterium]